MTTDRFDITGKVIIVTGAAQGIGRILAEAFAGSGAHVAVCDVQGDKAEAAAGAIQAHGGSAKAFAVDVTNPAAISAMVEALQGAHGRIDVLINNAGLYTTLGRRPFHELDLAEWEKVLGVNVTGPFLCAKAVAPAMIDAGWGRIVNVSSSTVALGVPRLTHYVASKAALIGMTRSMARELGGHGVTVNAVLPGLTETGEANPAVNEARRRELVESQSIPRKQVPQDLVGVMHFLASDASAFMTGQSLLVDGGAACI